MHTRAAWSRALLIAIAFWAVARPAFAQSAECVSSDCPAAAAPVSAQDIWLAASRIHEIKLQFVEALRRFTEAQAGTFGDEGPVLRESLSAMRRALDRWDRGIADFEVALIASRRSAEVHVALATVYLDRHRPDAALRELQSAAKLDPSRPDVETLRALAYGLKDDSTGAAGALRRAASLQASNPTIWYALSRHTPANGPAKDLAFAMEGLHRALRPPGTRVVAGNQPPFERVSLLREAPGISPIFPAARYVAGYDELRNGEYGRAMDRFARAMTDDPLLREGPARQAVSDGGSLLRRGELGRALEDLQAAVDRFPEDAEARRALALACLTDGQLERSIEHLLLAVDLAPGDVRARLLLAEAFAAAGRTADAEQALVDVTRLFPEADGARYRLGLLYERDTRLPEAVEALAGEGGLDPVVGRDSLFHRLGNIYVKQSNLEAAADAYSRRVEANPNNAEAHRLLGDIYFLQGDDDRALAEFEVAAFIEPDNASALVGSGQVHLRARRYAEAVRSVQEALSADPDGVGSEGYYTLGRALLKLGRDAEAQRALERSSEMQAQAMAAGQRAFEVDALARQAVQAGNEGRAEDALVLLERAAALAPESGTVRRQIGATLLEAGRLQEAVAELARAQAIEPTIEGHRLLADAHERAQQFAERDRQLALAAAMAQEEKLRRLRQLAGAAP